MNHAVVGIVTLCLVSIGRGAILHVGFGGLAQYSSPSTAIENASSGDTILISPHSQAYPGFSVPIPLTIIGAGFDSTSGGATCLGSGVAFEPGSSGSRLEGIWISAFFQESNYIGTASLRIDAGCDDITISKCLIQNNAPGSSAQRYVMGISLRTSGLIRLQRCIVWLSNLHPSYGTGVGISVLDTCHLAIENTIIRNGSYSIYEGPSNSMISIDHCMIQNCGEGIRLSDAICMITNSVVTGGIVYHDSPNVYLSYSATSGAIHPGYGNIQVQNSYFVDITPADPRLCDYGLSAESPLRDAGDPNSILDRDETRADIGIHGGQNPFDPSGTPSYPFVIQLNLSPVVVPEGGTMQIQSTGRVGSGQ